MLVASTDPATETPAPCETLLGHYCSILTSLSLSADGTLLASTDREGKARVSVMPQDPLQGAHEIHSYCLGHTNFVSCAAFVRGSAGGGEMLLTGSGDGTVRLWNPLDGRLLATLDVGAAAEGATEGESGEPAPSAAVLALQPSKDGTTAVVVLDGSPRLLVLGLDPGAGTIAWRGTFTHDALPIVTDICLDSAHDT